MSSISVKIGGVDFKVEANESTEGLYKEAAEFVNKKIEEYSRAQRKVDSLKLAHFVLLDMAVEILQHKKREKFTNIEVKDIEALNKKLEEVLK